MQSVVPNPFPRPSALDKVYLKELVMVAKHCYERGWSYGTAGNFSLRGHNGIIWQSPSGLSKGNLDPANFIPVDLMTATPVMPQSARPSLEMPVHLGIYRAMADAKTVVHTHPPYLVKESRAGVDLIFAGEEMQKPLGCDDHLVTLQMPVIKNLTPAEMPIMADQVQQYLKPNVPMVILSAHGVYAWGRSPLEALSFIEAAEFLCRTRN